jgi:UrcA family protein
MSVASSYNPIRQLKEKTMKTIRTKLYSAIYCVLGAAAFCSLTTPAGADPQDDPPTKIVKYGDLNIGTTAGAQVLYRRIQNAAREVCMTGMGTLQFVAAEHACIDKAIDDAVRGVNSVALSELRFGTQVHLASK